MKGYDPDRSIGFLIHEVARMLRDDFHERVSCEGVTQAQWRALVHLCRNEGCRQHVLAESLEIRPITLSRLVDRLVEVDLVVRRPDPEDRRATLLYLTKAAQPLLSMFTEKAIQTRQRALVGVSDGEAELLVSVLQRMKSNLG